MKIVTKLLLSLLSIIVILGVAAGVFVGAYVYKNYRELPNIEQLVSTYNPSIPTSIYDRNGVLIDSIYKEKREIVPILEVSENVKKAFISIEDKTFYNHYGINIRRNVGSLLVNIAEKRAAQGASTITQQLARNAFLSSEKKLSRKVKEILITFKIESLYTKDEILEKYLNEIYFGGGAYGIKAATRQFFRKLPSELNVAEAAMLAGIPNRPERYNPRRKLENALKRTHLIINEMYNDKVITESQYKEALEHKFIVLNNKMDKSKYDMNKTTFIYENESRTESNVPDYTDLIYSFLRTHKDKDGERVFKDEQIYSDGLNIYTSLDLKIQKVAKETIEKNPLLKKRDGLEVGMATIDTSTGEVIAIIGGKNYKTGNFNRGSMARRQLGSSSKPFLYFTALESGAGMNTTIDDSPIKFGKWEPKNYNDKYYGQITLLEALDRSLNMVSIKLLQRVGIPALKNTVQEIGVNFKLPDNLTAALGSYEGTPIQVAQAFSIFSNGGYSVVPILVKRIEDKHGNVLYSKNIEKEKKFDSLDISLITYMLESSVRNGTSKPAEVKDKDGNLIAQGGKTGTTNENRTVWFAGITPKYATAIYLGYDDNKPIAGNITGGSGAAPIWGEFYKALIEKNLYTPEKFEFIDDNIKNGVLIQQNLNSRNGLISSNGREFLVKSGGLTLESEGKFSGGISGLFHRENGESHIGNTPPETKSEKTSSFFDRFLGN